SSPTLSLLPFPLPLPSFFLNSYGDHPHLHLFPTRRSSDLSSIAPGIRSSSRIVSTVVSLRVRWTAGSSASGSVMARKPSRSTTRSEEHTSELQSRFELVWRLLLEKKTMCLIPHCLGMIV